MQKEAKMKFTVPKLIFLLATIAIIAIILSGCNIDDVLGYLSTVRVDEYDMEVNYYNEGATYLFSGKVVLTKYDEEDKAKDSWLEDNLGLRLNTGRVGDVKPILSGDFDEVGYASKQIFIKKDDLYYVFNIDSYTVPENLYAFAYDNYDDIVLSYEMNEYTAEEFSDKYDSGAIDWGIDDFG